MSTIQLEPTTLKTQATAVRTHKTAQEQTMQQLKTLVLSLKDTWKGEAQDAFVAKFQSMEHTLRKLTEVLEQYAKLMDTAANDMQNTDQNLRRIIQNI